MAAQEPESSLSSREAQLASLVKHPGWPEFLKALDEQIDLEVQRFAKEAMRQEQGGVSEGDLQHRRGVVRGMQQAVRVAHGAKARFDRHAEEENNK